MSSGNSTGGSAEEGLRETSSLILTSGSASPSFSDCQITFSNNQNKSSSSANWKSLSHFRFNDQEDFKTLTPKELQLQAEYAQAQANLEKTRKQMKTLLFHPGQLDEHIGAYNASQDFYYYTCCSARAHEARFGDGCTYSAPLPELSSLGSTSQQQWQKLSQREVGLITSVQSLRNGLYCRRCRDNRHMAPDCKVVACRWCLGTSHTSSHCKKVICSQCNDTGHIQSLCNAVPCRHCLRYVEHSGSYRYDYCPNSTCSKCNATGHSTANCTAPFCNWCSGHHVSANSYCEKQLCTRCKNKGHPASHCTASECELCHKIGHSGKYCPDKKTIKAQQQLEAQQAKEKAKEERQLAKEARQAKQQAELAEKEKAKLEREARKQEKELQKQEREKQKEARELEKEARKKEKEAKKQQ